MRDLNLFLKLEVPAFVFFLMSLSGAPAWVLAADSAKKTAGATAEEIDSAKLLCNEQIQKIASREDAKGGVSLNKIPLSSEQFLRDKDRIYEAYYKVEPHADEIDILNKGESTLRRELTFRGVFGKTEVRLIENDSAGGFVKENAPRENPEGKIGRLSAWARKMAEYVLEPPKDQPKEGVNDRDPKVLYGAIADFEKKQRGFLEKINGKHSFDRIIRGGIKFDSVVLGGASASQGAGVKFDAYLQGNQIVAYGLVENDAEEVAITFKPDSCAIDQFIFFEVPKESRGPGGASWSLTPEFCLNLEQEIADLAKDLPGEDDPTEKKFRCREQGASDDCHCPSGARIEHWKSTCHKTRQTPRVTAANRFEEFARQKKAHLGPDWSRKTFEKSRARCERVAGYLSSADQSVSGKTDNRGGVAR